MEDKLDNKITNNNAPRTTMPKKLPKSIDKNLIMNAKSKPTVAPTSTTKQVPNSMGSSMPQKLPKKLPKTMAMNNANVAPQTKKIENKVDNSKKEIETSKQGASKSSIPNSTSNNTKLVKNSMGSKYPSIDTPLSRDELDILRNVENSNIQSKKIIHSIKEPYKTNFDSKLKKMKKKLPASGTHIVYFNNKSHITNLRDRYGNNDAKFGADTRKKRNLLSTIIILFLILAILGTATYFTYYYLTKDDSNNVISGDIIFVNESDVVISPITNARMNQDIAKNISVQNATSGAMYVRFKISLKNGDGTALTETLGISYLYDTTNWYLDATQNMLYYKGIMQKETTLDIINGFQVNTDGSEDIWANKTLQVEFTVDIEQVSGQTTASLISKGWSQSWSNIFS